MLDAIKNRTIFIVFVSLCLCIIQIYIMFPGIYIPDSSSQLLQAQTNAINDWHPPIMSYLWQGLIAITNNINSLFVVQLSAYWIAIFLIADGLSRSGKFTTSVIILTISALPFFIRFNSLLTGDAQLVVGLLLGFSIVFWYRTQNLKPGPIATFMAVIFIVYAILVRSNSIFAAGPVLIYCFTSKVPIRYYVITLLSGVIAVVALASAMLINSHVFVAIKTEPLRSLLIFDLVGTAVQASKPELLSPILDIDAKSLSDCYTPIWWDTVAPWGKCGFIAGTVMNQKSTKISSDRAIYPASAKLRSMWVNAVLNNPYAYMSHRITHFNSEIRFYVGREGNKRNFFLWPVTWMGIVVLILTALRSSYHSNDQMTRAAQLLSLSAIFYGAAYLLVGVASEPRYFYWPILATFIAVTLIFPYLIKRVKEKDYPTIIAFLFLGSIIAIGEYSRMTFL